MLNTDLTTHAPGLEPFKASGDDPLVFEKETIYCGTFIKNGKQIKITPLSLSHWKRSIDDYRANGLSIAVPVEHTDNPELNRGEVIGGEVRRNSKGILSLYTKIKFRDEEAAKLAKTAQVSIFSPSEAVDGLGRKYKSPVAHVALTDNPMVPGLEKFKALAASFTGEVKMSVQTLAEKLALPIAGKEDAELESDIFMYVQDLQKQLDDAKKPSDAVDEEEPVAASLVTMVRNARTTQLESLRDKGHITPVVFADLKKKHIDAEDGIKMSLQTKKPKDDGFDALIEVLKKNEPVLSHKEKTKGQTIVMSNDSRKTGEKSATVRDAERRAEEAKSRR